ncbi:MAG: DUF423 domain-containing protein [Chitinophagaceae bacterium]|jgi:uncharacterized membrane protein YgdD (TMEM256/DUF423 family)|nr:DUF423 domain-containing protein [Chitinophagaceae bacterium]MBP6046577.1 DUF423 domain-containing protein [Ferruginibacter sp.]NMD29986.1 DUF423 domain-containing protein [Bacteroidota bacterium]MBK7089757.1 DUF423 domain-containing protein [Chitinophagaceae bacterium]MBK7347486.1 DUF423 domain-containing protein [Chitinophagaceae bacterium]
MHKGIIKTAALLGAVSVALGAFGAHGLKKMLDLQGLAVFETAVRYQFYHVFSLLAVGILYKEFATQVLLNAARFFIMGIILFCGSLYLVTFFKAQQIEGLNWVGAITPFGGVAFIIGWVMIFFSLLAPGKKN